MRQQVVLAGDPLQLVSPGEEPLAPQLDAAHERLARDFGPVEVDRRGDGLVARADQPAVAGRQADQHAQPPLGDLHAAGAAERAAAGAVVDAGAVDEAARKGVLHVFLEAVELLAGLGFLLGLAAAAARTGKGR